MSSGKKAAKLTWPSGGPCGSPLWRSSLSFLSFNVRHLRGMQGDSGPHSKSFNVVPKVTRVAEITPVMWAVGLPEVSVASSVNLP